MAPGDLGRVIGRQGRTAAAMRTLVSATAELDGDEGDARVPRRAVAGADCADRRDAETTDDCCWSGAWRGRTAIAVR